MKSIRAMIITGMVVLFCTAATGEPLDTDPAPVAGQTPPAGQVSVPDAARNAGGEQTAMTDIHDIKPLVSVPVPVSVATVLLWAAVCLLVAAGVVGAWLLWKRRKAPPVETLEAQLSPWDAALQKLATLSPDAMDGKPFYFLLSAIFREYLHGRFGIDGVEMTTEELLPHVETMGVERDLKREIKAFLISCDPVKFAGAPTRQEVMEKDLGFIRRIVEKTTALPAAPESDGEPAARDVSE